MRAAMVLAGAMLIALLPSADSQARENKVVKCNTGRAMRAITPGAPALVANVPRAMTPIDLNAVQFIDKSITRSMVVEGLFARRTETDTVAVTARFVNCTDRPLQILARSSFMDVTQAPTDPASAWTRVFLPPRGTGVYQEKSIGREQVQYYLIEISRAD